jgi:hypothetical protein
VLASAVLAPRFNPDTARWQAAIGFSLSALLFAVAAQTSTTCCWRCCMRHAASPPGCR